MVVYKMESFVDFLRKIVGDRPGIRKILSKVYRTFFYPVFSGHLFYNIYYFWFVRKNEIVELRKLGLENIHQFKIDTWRIGKSKDKAFRRYYRGIYNNKDCFVKIASRNDSTVLNEIVIQERLKGKLDAYSPRCLFLSRNFNDNNIIIVEYIDELRCIPEIYDVYTLENIIEKCQNLLINLEKIELIHADIHRGNLMMDNQENLILLDYGISKLIGVENDVDYISRPGTFYQKDGKYRIYDDAYSMFMLIKSLIKNKSIESNIELKKLEQRIGSVCFKTYTDGN